MSCVGAVPVELLVDLVGQPEQGQLAQGGEVADPEVVAERGVDLLRRVDVAVRHPAAQRLRGHVDQLDLVGRADDLVGHGLPLGDAGDLLDDVVERLQVLDVDRGQHGDAGVEQLLDVLPALGVAGAGHVGVRQLVDEGDLRAAGQDGVDVHLGEGRRRGRSASGGAPPPGRRACAAVCSRPWVSTKPTTTSVPRPLRAVGLLEHREGLADAGGGAEVDAQLSACHSSIFPLRSLPRDCLVEGQVELEHVDRRLAQEAERPAGGVLARSAAGPWPRRCRVPGRPGAPAARRTRG